MVQLKRYRNICFTLNNYDEFDFNQILNHRLFKYVIIGREIGKEGTPHLQGYGEFDKQEYHSVIKSKINDRMHFEPRYGTQKQAIAYCKKDKDYKEMGSRKIQGERTDLKMICDMIKDGVSMRELLEHDSLSVSHVRVLPALFTYKENNQRNKPTVHWYYGSTGTGKSKAAMSLSSNEETFLKNHTKWWDGIDNHETVVLDDFRASQMKFSDLLRLLDWNPYQCEIKGGFRWLHCKNIVITTPRSPKETYTNMSEDIKQLERRIDVIKNFDLEVQVSGNTIPTPND